MTSRYSARLFQSIILLICLSLTDNLSAQAAGNVAEIFKPLRIGQSVSLTESARGFEISLLDAGEIGSHTITELGSNHIALQDITKISKVWIPISSISKITSINITGKR
jgi:hypothetical protein